MGSAEWGFSAYHIDEFGQGRWPEWMRVIAVLSKQIIIGYLKIKSHTTQVNKGFSLYIVYTLVKNVGTIYIYYSYYKVKNDRRWV